MSVLVWDNFLSPINKVKTPGRLELICPRAIYYLHDSNTVKSASTNFSSPVSSVSETLYFSSSRPVFPPMAANEQEKGTPGSATGGQSTLTGTGSEPAVKVTELMKVVSPFSSVARTIVKVIIISVEGVSHLVSKLVIPDKMFLPGENPLTIGSGAPFGSITPKGMGSESSPIWV